MREPFPYESNGPLLSKFLVPDPIPRKVWEREEKGWKEQPGGETLIERMIRTGLLEKGEYLRLMSQRIGVQVVTEKEANGISSKTPEGQLLEQFGFMVLPSHCGQHRVAGGPDLPPDLERYLGKSASAWEWVMVPTGRATGNPGHRKIEETPGRDFPVSSSSAGTWLDQILQTCHARNASDIHLERSSSGLRARLRISGRMQELGRWPPELAGPALRLLKEWSGIPTSENTLPSDRRLQRTIGSRNHAFRVSHVKTAGGESLVLRQLAGRSRIRSPRELGIPEALLASLERCIRWEKGIILFTGPTGSGKTTTLFSILSATADSSSKIIAIEDPIEYEFPGAIQSQVDENSGWTFDRAVRAFLRQDPDIIVLGEMRDASSAEAACRAALTGHTVLATLHATCESSALDRLRGWGISSRLITDAVRLVVNQRLEAGTPRTARFSWSRIDPASGQTPKT